MTVIHLENISKQYRLGIVGSRTLASDLSRYWAKMRGREDPALKLGVENKLNKAEGEYIWALRNISFELQQGEVLGIIGKNGAGKSTLLKILSKVTAPTRGIVKIKGRVSSLLEVGTGFHPELTGTENIYLNGAILGMTRHEIRKKFDEIVAFSGIEKYIDTPVKRYSSGMYVRLAFAVAAHLEPEILIVDEVLAVGDAQFQKKCLGKMKDINIKEGRTVLFVSHNLDAVANFCNNCILLENGILTQYAKTKDVINNYLSSSRKESIYISDGSGKKLYIQKAFLANSQNEQTEFYDFEQNINLIISIRKAEGMTISEDVKLGISLLDKNRNRIFTVEKPVKQFFSDNNEATLKIVFPDPIIASGIYSFLAAIHLPKKEIYDNINDFCAFNILDNGTEYLKYGSNSEGIIYINSIWGKLTV
jgi:lipopolysaccharide transport system ATP-binding protein